MSVAASFFNEDQLDYMRALANMGADRLCWCGWDSFGKCYNCSRSPVLAELTAADKLSMRCEACGNEPSLAGGGRLVHLKDCTAEFRRERYKQFDLGGEA